jgi:cyclopropane-fatty-acyl-phospholipid synthase
LALDKLGLQPGMTLLDVGCGWGATMRRAIKKYDVDVVGLTLSKNHAAHVRKSFDEMDSPRRRRVLLNGWEQFDEPVGRIVSIGAFEHFGPARYDDFFTFAYHVLPADGVMLLQTITSWVKTANDRPRLADYGRSTLKYLVHPYRDRPGRLDATVEMVEEHSAKGGFTLTRRQSLQPHYARKARSSRFSPKRRTNAKRST